MPKLTQKIPIMLIWGTRTPHHRTNNHEIWHTQRTCRFLLHTKFTKNHSMNLPLPCTYVHSIHNTNDIHSCYVCCDMYIAYLCYVTGIEALASTLISALLCFALLCFALLRGKIIAKNVIFECLRRICSKALVLLILLPVQEVILIVSWRTERTVFCLSLTPNTNPHPK